MITIIISIWGRTRTPDGKIITSQRTICFLTHSDIGGFSRDKTFAEKENGEDITLIKIKNYCLWLGCYHFNQHKKSYFLWLDFYQVQICIRVWQAVWTTTTVPISPQHVNHLNNNVDLQRRKQNKSRTKSLIPLKVASSLFLYRMSG